MTNKWAKFDESVIKETHGDIFFYRDLYEGNHSKIFSRAKDLIEKGEIVDNIIFGTQKAQNVQTPYIVANISKLIPEIPAMLVSRSIGNIQTSFSPDDFQAENINAKTEEIVDDPKHQDARNIIDVQQDLIRQIEKNSNLAFEHWGNVLQQQVDGGLVGVPWMDERGLRLEFKARDVYYPHDDGMGADLAYDIEIEGREYLRVYREQVKDGDLHTSHMLYRLNEQRKTEVVPDEEAMDLLDVKELEKEYKGRGRPFIIYWANDKTFMNPLGVSCLKNQEGKQDEINWTLTRNAITFERNGKPRIAVSKEIMQALEDRALDRYGDESKIDHRDLEITTFDEHGKSLEVIQIDITKIGDIQWVKDLTKLMLMETQTSEKVVDFYMDSGSGAAQSGVAKFYDLLTSLLKAEQIQSQYIYFLQQLVESALWLANHNDPAVIIEEPEILLKSMIPISRKELVEENNLAYGGANGNSAQSLETTVRRNNPNASEEWISEELYRIEAEKSNDDTFSLLSGRQTAEQMMGNRDAGGNPIQEVDE